MSQWDIIKIPIDFNDGSGPVPKFFIVLGYINDACILLKTTSNPTHYEIGGRFSGCAVKFRRGDHHAFEAPVTYIDPENAFAVKESKLQTYAQKGELSIYSPGVSDRRNEFVDIIQNHRIMVPPYKKKMLDLIKSSIST